MAWKHWAEAARNDLLKVAGSACFRNRVPRAHELYVDLKTIDDLWPTLREATAKIGGLGYMLVGPGMYDALECVGATRTGSKVVRVQSQADRDVFLVAPHETQADFLREFPSAKLARIVVMHEARMRGMDKRGSRQPRCDLVPASEQGHPGQWRDWIRQFPVVARVRGRALRVASDDMPKLRIGKMGSKLPPAAV